MAARGELEPIEPSVAAAEERLVSASRSHATCREIAESDPRSCLLLAWDGVAFPILAAALALAGYRVTSRQGHHRVAVEAGRLLLGKTRCCRASEGSGDHGTERCTSRTGLTQRTLLTSSKTWSSSGPSSGPPSSAPAAPDRPVPTLAAPSAGHPACEPSSDRAPVEPFFIASGCVLARCPPAHRR